MDRSEFHGSRPVSSLGTMGGGLQRRVKGHAPVLKSDWGDQAHVSLRMKNQHPTQKRSPKWRVVS